MRWYSMCSVPLETGMIDPCCARCTAYAPQGTNRGVCSRWKERKAIWGIVMPDFHCALFSDAKHEVRKAAEKVEQDRQSKI